KIASLIRRPDLRFLTFTSFQSLTGPILSFGSSSSISRRRQRRSLSSSRLRPPGNIQTLSCRRLTRSTRPFFAATSFDDFAIPSPDSLRACILAQTQARSIPPFHRGLHVRSTTGRRIIMRRASTDCRRLPRKILSSRPSQRLGRDLAELLAVSLGKVAEVPEAVGQRGSLDAVSAGDQSPPHQPKPAQTEIAVQAHAAIALHCVVHGAHRYADVRGEFLAVDDIAEMTRQRVLDVPEDLEVPGGVRLAGPARRDEFGNGTVDRGQQGF